MSDTSYPHRFFAPCPRGLEQPLAQELTQLDLAQLRIVPGGVAFQGTLEDGWRTNLWSRVASRILMEVAHESYRHEDDVYEIARGVFWENVIDARQTLRVDVTSVRSPLKSEKFAALRVKDAICDVVREHSGERPSVDTVRPDVRVHLNLNERWATVYLDMSGESLFKRGWRYEKREAPIRENLAAGMLMLAGWNGQTPVFDPMCGSGTILIEAAYMAANRAPGALRPFGFERWQTHDPHAFRKVREEAQAQARTLPEGLLFGADVDVHAIDAAKANAHRSHTEHAIRFSVGDARDSQAPSSTPGILISNPPYDVRISVQGVKSDELEQLEPSEAQVQFFSEFSSTLKNNFQGWQAWLISADHSLPSQLRLKPAKKIPLYNGALDCRMFGFEMIAGSMKKPKSTDQTASTD